MKVEAAAQFEKMALKKAINVRRPLKNVYAIAVHLTVVIEE